MPDEAEVPEKKKGWRGKLWILIAVLVIAALGEAGRRTWIYFKGTKSVQAAGQAGKGGAGPSAETHSSRGEAVKVTAGLDPFLVNLADPQAVRFVKVTFQLGMTGDSEEFSKNPVAIAAARDAIISLLSAKTSEQILTVEGKDKLRKEVRDRVNSILGASKTKVQNVYIVEFVVQL
jgi:flagellar FliL protein